MCELSEAHALIPSDEETLLFNETLGLLSGSNKITRLLITTFLDVIASPSGHPADLLLVCLLVCSIGRVLACSFARLLVYSLARLLVCLIACLLGCLLACFPLLCLLSSWLACLGARNSLLGGC